MLSKLTLERRLPMNKFHRTLLSLFIAAGLGLGSLPGSEMAQAAEPKRKSVSAKKSVKPAQKVAKKKTVGKAVARKASAAAVAAKTAVGAEPAGCAAAGLE